MRMVGYISTGDGLRIRGPHCRPGLSRLFRVKCFPQLENKLGGLILHQGDWVVVKPLYRVVGLRQICYLPVVEGLFLDILDLTEFPTRALKSGV